MSSHHTVLYRKYRPKTFAQVRGQEHITETLEQAITKKTLGHSYLFSGPRGTGKTSVARIFAQALGTHEHDIFEMDAASNRKIEDVRELREAVFSLPMHSEHKVYIIDEVHMLTPEAFNAFLKTLEEPPRHAIFILATTELHKIPETIISRCQVFRFKTPTQYILSEAIRDICKQEEFTIDEDAVEIIAMSGNGSFRDTLGTLEQVHATAQKKHITYDTVATLIGLPPQQALLQLLSALNAKNTGDALDVIRTFQGHNGDIAMVTRIIIEHLRFVLLLRFGNPSMQQSLQSSVPESILKHLAEYAKNKDSGINSKTLETFMKALESMRYAFIKEIPLELACINLFEKKD